MTREELLERLHHIGFVASLTYLPDEEALEIEIMNNTGTSYFWDSTDSWYLYKLHVTEVDKLSEIKKLIFSEKLEEEDLKETIFEKLLEEHDPGNCLEILRNLVNLPDNVEYVYCWNDNGELHFFKSEEDLKKALSDIPMDTNWEDLDDSDLESFLAQVEEEKDEELPYFSFDEE